MKREVACEGVASASDQWRRRHRHLLMCRGDCRKSITQNGREVLEAFNYVEAAEARKPGRRRLPSLSIDYCTSLMFLRLFHVVRLQPFID